MLIHAKLFFFILGHLKWNAVQCVYNIGRNFSEVLVKISGIFVGHISVLPSL